MEHANSNGMSYHVMESYLGRLSGGCFRRGIDALLFSFALILASNTAIGQTMTINTFEAGDEGWTVVNWDGGGTPHVPTWNTSGGNPGGYVWAPDAQGDGFWNAPASVLGDWSAGYGATLSYDIYSGPSGWKMNDIYIQGENGLTICYWFPTNPPPQWTTYSVVLDAAAGWQAGMNYDTVGTAATEAQIRSVLANVVSVRIREEYAYGSDDCGLDNVRLVQGVQAPSFGRSYLEGAQLVMAIERLVPGQIYQLQQKRSLEASVTWEAGPKLTATNAIQTLKFPIEGNSMFYRLWRQ